MLQGTHTSEVLSNGIDLAMLPPKKSVIVAVVIVTTVHNITTVVQYYVEYNSDKTFRSI